MSYENLDAMQALVNRIVDRAETTHPYAAISLGSDPPENGICLISNGGMTTETHLDGSRIFTLPVLINGKHTSQKTLLGALGAIHEALTRPLDYADLSDERVQVISVETTAYPAIIGREQNRQWICGSSINVYFYWR